MKRIYIGFSKSNKNLPLFSWLIRLYQKTEFSHVYIRIPHETMSDSVFHASEGLVHHMSGTQFDKKHRVVTEFEIPIKECAFHTLLMTAHEISGSNYGYLQNLGILIVKFASFFNIKINNPFKKGWNCSELVLYMLNQIYNDFKHLDKNIVTPKDLYKALCTSNIRRKGK